MNPLGSKRRSKVTIKPNVTSLGKDLPSESEIVKLSNQKEKTEEKLLHDDIVNIQLETRK